MKPTPQRPRQLLLAAAALLLLGICLALFTTLTPGATHASDSTGSAPCSAPGPVPTTALQLQNLSGVYADPTSYEYGKGVFGKRVFSFNHGTWTLHFTLALDPALQNVVFTYRCIGTYELLKPSSAVANAYDALFYTDKKYVTLKTRDAGLAQAFGLAACGLKPDVEQDVSVVGCAGWRPVSVCREDHDLLALDANGGLYFGTRPRDNDMCTAGKRPTSLTPAVVKQ